MCICWGTEEDFFGGGGGGVMGDGHSTGHHL